MDQTVSEHELLGGVTFTIINTGFESVTVTNYMLRASPRFGPDDSGDIAYDRIQVISTTGQSCVYPSGNSMLLIGTVLFGSTETPRSCVANVTFAILDNDPLDTFNPVNDSADWAVLLQVSARNNITGDPVPDEIGHAYIRVVDEPIPEPGTATLVSSGLVVVSLLYKRHKWKYRSDDRFDNGGLGSRKH